MPNRVFQSVIQQMKGAIDRHIGVIDEGGVIVACSDLSKMGEIRTGDPASTEAQTLVAELQQFITDHYYTCTREILCGLGEMYSADERFAQNIDNAGGEGTAAFATNAIRIFCNNK